MFSKLLSRRWLQFRLRTLLLLTLAAAIGCCWFVPFTREEHWPDGTIKARYRMQRRTWNGSLVAAGEQWEFYEHTSQPERRWVQYGGLPGADCDGRNCTHWDATGKSNPGDQFDHLIWLIMHTISPDSWADNGGSGTITGFPCNISCSFVDEDDIPSAEEILAEIPEPDDPFAQSSER